jgi:hypothetical protein
MPFTLIYIYLDGFYFVTTAIKVCSDDEPVQGAPK